MNLLANENFPFASVLLLRKLGYDIISIGSTEHSGTTDEYVMQLGEQENRTILTFDRDYGELIFKLNYRPKAGVIFLRLDHYEPDEPGVVIHKLLTEYNIDPEFSLNVFDGTIVRQRRY